MPPDDTYGDQPSDRVNAAAEKAQVKAAIKDRAALATLRRELHVRTSGATTSPPPPPTFRGKKQLIFEALLQGCSQTEAAVRAGTSRQTVHRYVHHDEEFGRALKEYRAERSAIAVEGVADLLPLAVRRLKGILMDPAAEHRDVLAAVKEVLDRGGIVARKALEVSGPDGGPVAVAVDVGQLATLSPAQLRALAQVDVAAGVDGESATEEVDP